MTVNEAQAGYWDGDPGRKWVEHDTWMTTIHQPVTALLLERSGIRPGDRVLDIGCGTGFSTRALAVRAGAGGRVTGLDISGALLDAARARPSDRGHATIRYVKADAQDHDFQGDSYDRIASQFGVMFFSDPVAAFANIRRAAAPGAGLALACWGSVEENPWFRIPKAAGEAVLEPLPAEPGAPSPTAFADREMVSGILPAAGWEDIGADPVAVDLTPPGDLDDLVAMAFHVGPVARLMLLHGAGEDIAKRIAANVRRGFAPYDTPLGVRIPACINIFTARAAR